MTRAVRLAVVRTVAVEMKAAGAHKFDPHKHPRDRHGRFIRVGASVDLGGGKTGRVVAVSGDKITVDRGNGRSVDVSRHQVAVVDGNAGARKPAATKPALTATPAGSEPKPSAARQRSARTGRARPQAGRATLTVQPASPPVQQVSARDLKAGDTAVIDGTAYTVTADPVPDESVPDNLEVQVRDANGQATVYSIHPDEVLTRVTGPARKPVRPPKPDRVPPPGVSPARGRVALRTYQRRLINEHRLDTLSPDGDVRRAATRVRDYEPLTADDARAMAAGLRAEADRPGLPKRRAGALRRAATQFDVLHDSLVVQQSTQATPVAARDVTVGQRIRIPGIGSKAPVEGVVSSAKTSHGGRIVTLSVTDDAGQEHTQALMRGTHVATLPDLPERDTPPVTPQPEPEPAGAQVGQVSQVGVGDYITTRDDGGEHHQGTVTAIGEVAPGFYRMVVRGDDGQSAEFVLPSTSPVGFLPAPVDHPLPEPLTGEEEISHRDIRTGDRIRYYDGRTGEDHSGLVVAVTRKSERGGGGMTDVQVVPDGNTGGSLDVEHQRFYNLDFLARLGHDPAGFDRFRDHEFAERAAARAVELGLLQRLATREVVQVLRQKRLREGTTLADAAAGVRAYGRSHPRRRPAGRPFQAEVEALLPDSPDEVRADVERNLDTLSDQAWQAGSEAIAAAIENAVPQPRETNDDVVSRMLNVIDSRGYYETLQGSNQAAATALYGSIRDLDRASQPEHAGEARGEVGQIGGGLEARVAHLRAMLGDPAAFNVHQVRRRTIGPFTLDDLRAGKKPDIVEVHLSAVDKAADGGPGESTMRNLETVLTIGRLVDAEVQAEIRHAGVDTDALREQKAKAEAERDAAAAALRDFTTEQVNSPNTLPRVQQEVAAEHGFESLGALRRAIFNARHARDDEELGRLNAILSEAEERAGLNKVMLRLAELQARRATALAELEEATQKINTARADAVRTVLGRVRKFGASDTAKFNFDKTERAPSVRALRWAESNYPTDWIAHAATGTTKVLTVKRGYYAHDDQGGTIALSPREAGVPGLNRHDLAAVHEMGHRMEHTVPGLVAAEEAFLWHRTTDSGTKVGARTRTGKNAKRLIGLGEYGRRDEFPEHYTGKEYDGAAYEIVSTGAESLFAGSDYLDQDFQEFMLGVLAAL